MLAIAAAVTALFGGAFADNLGVQGTYRPTPVPGLTLEAGVAYTRYLTLVAGAGYEVPLGGPRGEAPASFVATLAWGTDTDAAGGARTTVHHLMLRVGVEARLTSSWFVLAEIVPVRFPLSMRASRDGESWTVPVDATDALLFRPGVGVGLRF